MKEIAKKFSCFLSDKVYLSLRYHERLGKWPDLKSPKLYNEKMQWLKLHDRRSEYSSMVDKYEAKKYIAGLIGEQYVVPTYGVWDRFEEIDFDSLPDQFVLKCTHNSGGIVLCKDKKTLDLGMAKKKIEKCLKENYFWHSREWPYKNVKPRIIAEKYLDDQQNLGAPITDYKFLCFHGEPKILFLTREISADPYADCYDMNFHKLDLQFPDPNSDEIAQKPARFDEMKELARKLSKEMIHLRVDFYEVNGKLYVGELTFYHCAGLVNAKPEKWNRILGDWIKLPIEY